MKKRRPDFIQNMLDHENNPDDSFVDEQLNENLRPNSLNKKSLTNNEILSQSFLFLTAGYETVASNLCFIAYNLATNTHCQDKLIEEIDKVLEKHVIN
jgi:cytochrome P450